jgi:alkylation response protein AidB-like acyl-CoA dehydrogenase
MELDEFRGAVDHWLDEHEDELRPAGAQTLEQELKHLGTVKRTLWDAGWARCGWPERVGGSGGSPLLRAYLGETLTARDVAAPNGWTMAEFLAPTLLTFARRELADEAVPLFLRGDEMWCQGFSEPGTGSNLASLQCRAVRSDDGWRVTGQKVWTSYAQFSRRCILLTRTGAPDSAHRGITAFFVDMDTPGITVRPLLTMHGVPEFCEVFFDDVAVPDERMLGEEGGGWAVAMGLLPLERSTSMWHRGAYLFRELRRLLDTAVEGALPPERVGCVVQQLYAFRARSRETQWRAARGEPLGPETSVDKVLLSRAEQEVFDLVLDGRAGDVLLGDDPEAETLRERFLYSRASTIYGGSLEIQRNIIARRVLGLGAEA